MTERRKLPVVLVASRDCGECSACCELEGVDELAKAPLTRCSRQRDGGGCDAYAIRPPACIAFRCLWHHGLLEDDGRPDRLGVMLDGFSLDDQAAGTSKPGILAKEVAPNGFERAESTLRWLVARTGQPILLRRYDGQHFEFNGFGLTPPSVPIVTV